MYKVPNVGWALRTLVDLPPGRFTFTYAGFVYSEEFATKLGSDDTYFADLDMHFQAAHAEDAADSEPIRAAVEKSIQNAAESEV